MSDNQQRAALRERIDKARARLSQLPAVREENETGGNLLDIAKRNPVILVGAAAALGLAIGALSRRGGKAATATGLFGRVATDALIAFALAMVEKSRQRSASNPADEREA